MKLLETIISIYAPLECVGCAAEGEILCPNCIPLLPAPDSRCYRCNRTTKHGRTCALCRADSALVSANAATIYQDVAKELILKLKFSRVQAAAEIMATIMAQQYSHLVAEDVLIVPVPTATKRVRNRGYDQAVLIARSFARQTGRRYCPLLLRVGSQEQIGAGKVQRQQQLHGVIRVKRPDRVRGARILLVDDVMTTGATLEAAAGGLVQLGAKAVGSLVFARAMLE